MELRHLRYYVAVAEERHFRRAAERLHIAQPPLSQQIKHLEAELGVQLLRRTTRSVEPTAAGLRFLDRARDILAAVEDAAAESRLVADGHVGRVALGFTGSATYELLPSLSRALGEELPGIELELHGELLTPDQEARLLDGSLDVGFLRPPVRSHDISVFSLRREPLVAVVPATHHAAGATSVSLARGWIGSWAPCLATRTPGWSPTSRSSRQHSSTGTCPSTRVRRSRRWRPSWASTT